MLHSFAQEQNQNAKEHRTHNATTTTANTTANNKIHNKNKLANNYNNYNQLLNNSSSNIKPLAPPSHASATASSSTLLTATGTNNGEQQDTSALSHMYMLPAGSTADNNRVKSSNKLDELFVGNSSGFGGGGGALCNGNYNDTQIAPLTKAQETSYNNNYNNNNIKMHSNDPDTSSSVIVNIGAGSSSGDNKLRRIGSGVNRTQSTTNTNGSGRRTRKTSTSSSKQSQHSVELGTRTTQSKIDNNLPSTSGTRHRRQHSLSAHERAQHQAVQNDAAGTQKTSPPIKKHSNVSNSATDASAAYNNQRHSSSRERTPTRQQRSFEAGDQSRSDAPRHSHHHEAHAVKQRRRQRRISSASTGSGNSSASTSGSSCNGSCSSDDGDSQTSTSSGEPNLPYPGFPEIAFKYLTQDTRPRNWCLTLITNPWFERVSIIVILLNCITLGMYQPCVDDACVTNRCKMLQIFDDIIFAFFALEMSIKMVAMGLHGKNTYLADSWNFLDFFIVFAGGLEYVMHVENLNLTAIRTIRVLRPLRAINRIPSMRILVMLLLDTLPMLGNVLLLCFFVFFIFGIIGVQLWEGILRQRCVLELPEHIDSIPEGLPDEYRVRVRINSISFYYEFSKEQDYICSKPNDSGMHLCADLPPYRIGPMLCTEEAKPHDDNLPTNQSCVNWNQYYSNCQQSPYNPFQGTISFDNIGMAWVAIFLVISLEGWTDIMYYVQDAHSFWDWIYFVLLIVIGSFFMINLCLVVIATQFSETKKREMERMRQERARYTSSSTLASSTNNSEPATCYAEIVKYIAHLWRRFKRRMIKKYRLYKSQRQQRREGLLPNSENLTFSPSRIKCHHPKCPKYNSNNAGNNRKPSNIQDQMITVMVPLNSNNNLANNNNQQHIMLQQQHQQTQPQNQHQQQAQQMLTTYPQQQRLNNYNQTTTTMTTAATAAATQAAAMLDNNIIAAGNNNNNGYTMARLPPQQQQQQQQQHSAQHSSSENSEQSLGASNGAGRSSNLKKPKTINTIANANLNTVVTTLPNATTTTMSTTNGNATITTITNQLKGDTATEQQLANHKQQHLQQLQQQKTILLKIPQSAIDSEQLISHPCTSGFLSPPTSASRRPSVMFNEYVLLHTPPAVSETNSLTNEKNVCSSEKMTQAGDGSIWQVNLPQNMSSIGNNYTDCSELGVHDAMTCQELLAFSVAFSAALPTGQSTLESFYSSLARCDPHTAEAIKNQQNLERSVAGIKANQHMDDASTKNGGNNSGGGNVSGSLTGNYIEDYSCCYDLYQNVLSPLEEKPKQHSRAMQVCIQVYRCISRICIYIRRYIKILVEHKYFQQGILLAILINTLSMGIEYHKQPYQLTVIVEISNIVFSGIFAVEMLLKVIAEGPFRYIANGFNVFDGIIVILSGIEIGQQLLNRGTGGGGSGLSVLRTFRLLRILKLVRFMPNLRRQLFVMLRTMDNVAVFFSLLVLFIFIFSILGMNLFGCKFCEEINGERKCDRKNFDTLLWALVTVFQILTQEDWNVVLFNGMEKTSHWAALYFVALMTFGNYVLFNLLVAILVEGFSSERNERREREQRELVKKLREETLAENFSDGMYDESRSDADSSSTNESYYDVRARCYSAEDFRKLQDSTELITHVKNTNIHKQRLIQQQDYQMIETATQGTVGKYVERDYASRIDEDDKKNLKKTYSIKERRADAARLSKIRSFREPPIITTTAATPQDSPNTTIEPSISFRMWQQEAEQQTPASATILLKPPTIFSGQFSPLDEGIPSIDLIPPSPVLQHKSFNILNASNLGSNDTINTCNLVPKSSFVLTSALNNQSSNISNNNSVVVLDDITKNYSNTTNKNQTTTNTTTGPIYVPTISSTAASLQPQIPAHLLTERLPLPLGGAASAACSSSSTASQPIQLVTLQVTATATPTTVANSLNNLQTSQSQTNATAGGSDTNALQRLPSLKRFGRNSSRRSSKKSSDAIRTIEDEEHQLNNGSDQSYLLDPHSSSSGGGSGGQSGKSSSKSPNMSLKGRTKDTNRLSPQNSMRRMSTTLSVSGGGSGVGGSASGPASRRASACMFNNSQLYQNLNQPTKFGGRAASRRMSSVELAFSKTSQLNLHNLETSRKSFSYTNSKLDLDKWQKSYTNLSNENDMLQQYIEARDKRKSSVSSYHMKRSSKDQVSLQAGTQPSDQQETHSPVPGSGPESMSKIKLIIERLNLTSFFEERETYSLYMFPEDFRFRQICTWFVNQKWFDNVVLLFIALNCITLAMERPNIPPESGERLFLSTANYVFTVVFTIEMFIKVVATGMFYGTDAYFTSGWNLMDGSLVMISIVDLLMSLLSSSSPRIFGILRVFRLLRSLRPLRVINRAPGLKLVVQTLLSSLRPIGNIVLICCTFFIIFGILGVQLFKGTFYYCEGENIKHVRNRTDCEADPRNVWTNRKYNFDDLGKALMSLFVLSSRDGWVNIMYTGLDAVGVDQQPIVNYNEWRLLYFIAFILLVGFFVLNMFVGVVVENFHRCREEQEKEEKIRRAAKRALQMEKKRRRMHEPPYYTNYSPSRMFVHNVVTSKYFDLAIAAVIGLNVVTMAMEYYRMPMALQYALKIFNYFFTAVFILEANMKLVALGWHLYMKDKWNQLDVSIVLLSIVGIVLEELERNILPINPTIIRVMRVMRIARVLKLLKMAKGIRALLDTVMQALPQVGNLGLLFFLLFFIFAALGVELFGRLECSDEIPCQGLGEHAHFANFGMAFLTLFRVATGDNWNGIMKDTLRDNCDDATECFRNCCVSSVIAPIFFVIFVLMAQFVLVNVVVAVLMKHLEESHKQMEDEMDMEVELERELVREQELEQEQKLCQQLQEQAAPAPPPRQLSKVKSLPMNFTYSTPSLEKKSLSGVSGLSGGSGGGGCGGGRRQTVQYLNQQNSLGLAEMGNALMSKHLNSAGLAAERSFDTKLQIPNMGGRRGRRSSTAFRKRGMLTKERSLDEQAIRRRNLESKRTSCDSLPWVGDGSDYTKSGTIFESLESDGSPTSTFDIRSVRSEDVQQRAAMPVSPTLAGAVNEKPPAIGRIPTQATRPRMPGRSLSTDHSSLSPARSSLLAVPRAMPPRSRSGSTKQLFKQQALDEDPDMDKSSLLLPVQNEASGAAGGAESATVNADMTAIASSELDISAGLSKSDSADILRIINERRRIDQRDNSGNEDSDYKELLLFKSSAQSSADASAC